LLVSLLAFACAACLTRRSHEARPTQGARRPVESYTLANGLRVVLEEEHRTPQVAVELAYDVGMVADPPGHAGLSQLVERLMFQGSRHVAAHEQIRAIHALGGDLGAFTARETTLFWNVVPAAELPRVLWYESERMAFAFERVTPEVLAREQRNVDLANTKASDSGGRNGIDRLILQELFPAGHLYHPTSSTSDWHDVDLNAVRAFYADNYALTDAALIVSGDFERSGAQRWIDWYFGQIPARAAAPRRVQPVLAPNWAHKLELEARVDQPSIVLSWVTPPSSTDEQEFEVLAEYVTQHMRLTACAEARLFNVVARQRTWRRAGVFDIRCRVAADVPIDTALADLEHMLVDLRRQGVSLTALQEGSMGVIEAEQRDQDDVVKRGWWLADAIFKGRSARLFDESLRRYANVSDASMRRAVSWLSPEGRLTTIVHPNPTATVGREAPN
jgi:hypothetical protein